MKRLTFIALFFCGVTGAFAATPANVKTVRLLTIGNSFSANATKYLEPLAKAAGHVLVHKPIVVGGASLQLHWNRAFAHERNPSDPEGWYLGRRGLREELAAKDWDVVTIQQSSTKSHDPKTYQPFARQLFDYIKQHAPKAEVMIHQTWAYREDDPRFAPGVPRKGEPRSRDEMHQMLTAAYKGVCGELGVKRIPVGDAFDLVETDSTWGFRADPSFDPKAEGAEVPAQKNSLHVGWRKVAGENGGQVIELDGHHANSAGQYLAACVWFEVLFREPVIGNEFLGQDLAPDYAKFLQQAAHRAVEAMGK
ncbi:MAG: hypothetical protein RIS92_2348 [Verrucomicrobiota bacterium]